MFSSSSLSFITFKTNNVNSALWLTYYQLIAYSVRYTDGISSHSLVSIHIHMLSQR